MYGELIGNFLKFILCQVDTIRIFIKDCFNWYFKSSTDNVLLSSSINHGFSLIVLLALQCSNSFLIRGFDVDGYEPGGKCVEFTDDQHYFLRLFLKTNKNKKKNTPICDENNSKPLLVKEPNIIIIKS